LITQLPPVKKLTVEPKIEQTEDEAESMAKLTERPEVAVAATVYEPSAVGELAVEVKVIVWAVCRT
jgi:hypothetical protein